MFILNIRSMRSDLPRIFYVYASGTVKGQQRGTGTLSASFDLTNFPMDSQELPLTFITLRHGPDELHIIFEKGGMEEVFTEQGWEVTDVRSEYGVYEMEFIKGLNEEETTALARFDFIIEAERSTSYYLWKVFVPLCLIVCASWAVFWIDPKQLGIRTGIGTAMMITIIAFLFSMQQILPQIDYLTRMDIFIYCSLILVFLAFIVSVTLGSIAGQRQESRAHRVEKWCRVIFPMVFGAIIIWLWWM